MEVEFFTCDNERIKTTTCLLTFFMAKPHTRTTSTSFNTSYRNVT